MFGAKNLKLSNPVIFSYYSNEIVYFFHLYQDHTQLSWTFGSAVYSEYTAIGEEHWGSWII